MVPEIASGRARAAAIAFAAVTMVAAVEYGVRRFLAPMLPAIGAPRVNDMLFAGTAYVLLGVLAARYLLEEPATSVRVRRARWRALLRWEGWVGGGAAFWLAVGFALLDARLFADVHVPAAGVAQSPTVLMAGAGPVLSAAALLLFNGLVIPIAEELLWRGTVQVRLAHAVGIVPAIAITSLLFSVKHALVDASLGRLLAITAAGAVLGVVALRASWIASALSHVLMNTGATLLALATPLLALLPSLGGMTEPQTVRHEVSPIVGQRLDAVKELVRAPDRSKIEQVFAPSFLRAIPPDKTLAFFEQVRRDAGSCSEHRLAGTKSAYYARYELTCERRAMFVTLAVAEAPPNLITGLLIKPKP